MQDMLRIGEQSIWQVTLTNLHPLKMKEIGSKEREKKISMIGTKGPRDSPQQVGQEHQGQNKTC